MSSPYHPLILLILICNVFQIHSESSVRHSHHKYDVAQFVRDASLSLRDVKRMQNSIDDTGISVPDEFQWLSAKNLNNIFVDMFNNNDSIKCKEDLNYVFESILTPWAMQMIDSYAKPERGVLQGSVNWLGDFDECMKVYAPKTNTSLGDFHGKYCTLQVTAHFNKTALPLKIGTCLPDTCYSVNSINETSNKALTSIFSDIKLVCQTKFTTLTTDAICVIFLMSIFILLSLIGSSITVYETIIKIETGNRSASFAGFNLQKASPVNVDIDKHSQHGDDDSPNFGYTRLERRLPTFIEKIKPFFSCFCLFTNGAKLLDTSESEGQLLCLHGIRFLSMSWVIVCHTYLNVISYIRNMGELLPMLDSLPFQIILNGFFSVDSFFLLSGFLVAYLFFEQASKNNGKMPWLYIYIHRFIRLTPVYMIMLAFNTTIYPYMADGPMWTSYEVDPICHKDWWRNLLYINNFSDSQDQCVGWSWYLANDMQFFVITPIFLIALWRSPPIGFAILALFLNATTVANFVISYQNELVPGLGNIIGSSKPQAFIAVKFMDYFNMVYIKPYTRISPYLVGIALAYYLYWRKQNNYGKNSLAVLVCGWIIASTITLICQFGLYHNDMSILEVSFYNAFSRTCFALGLAWVIYVCLTGQGGFINSILSFKLFIPLSRLTYCAYLIHMIIQFLYYTSLRSLIDFSHLTMVVLFLGFLVISYAAALITSLLFESPVIRLEKLIRNKLTAK